VNKIQTLIDRQLGFSLPEEIKTNKDIIALDLASGTTLFYKALMEDNKDMIWLMINARARLEKEKQHRKVLERLIGLLLWCTYVSNESFIEHIDAVEEALNMSWLEIVKEMEE